MNKQNSLEMRHQNDVAGLTHVSRFRWLRMQELGWLMRPETHRNGYVQTTQMVKSWVERELVITRKLPGRCGSICVLAAGGVRLLAAAGVTAVTGKDIGKETPDGWRPGLRWMHDLLAHGVLVRLAAQSYQIFPEAVIRQGGPLSKIPDGLAVKGADVLVLEVERAHKGGSGVRRDGRLHEGGQLGKSLAAIASGRAEKVLDHTPTRVAIVYDTDEIDSRGSRLNHKLQVTTMIQKQSTSDVDITWLAVTSENHGVVSMTESRSTVVADISLRILSVLNANGWHEDINGFLCSSYGKLRVKVIFDEAQVGDSPDAKGFWCFQVDNLAWTNADSEADAKRRAARFIASRSSKS